MSGYFENLIDSYAPSPDAVMPAAVEAWQPEERPGRDLPNTPEPETVSGETGASLPPMTEETPIAPLPAPFENTDEDSGDDNIVPLPLSERIVDHVTERIEPIPDPPIPRDADTAPDDPPPRPPDIIHETHEHFHEDHFHHETPLISEAPQAQDPEPASQMPLPPEDFEADATDVPLSEPLDISEIEQSLAAALAHLHGIEALPSDSGIAAQDFEPERTPDIAAPDPEPVREVTREVVREVHHHHTETRIEPPAPPAPRSAAEASRIGPIRFASDWKTGGPN